MILQLSDTRLFMRGVTSGGSGLAAVAGPLKAPRACVGTSFNQRRNEGTSLLVEHKKMNGLWH